MSPMQQGTALIVEDQQPVNDWLCAQVHHAFPRLATVTADSLQSARETLAGLDDCRLALVDLSLPDGSGLELIREIRQQKPQACVIVTTVHGDDDSLFSAIAAGAQGYLLKEQSNDLFLLQLRQLEQGQPPLSPSIARRMLDYFRERPQPQAQPQPQTQSQPQATPDAQPPASDSSQLTPRETDVLAAIGRGLRVNEVARQLGLAESTVASYIKSIYAKLNISTRAEAAIEAVKRGLA